MADDLALQDRLEADATVLEAPLPGEVFADRTLVQASVADINAIWRAGGVETARRIGELVVTRFFGGVVAYAHSRKRTHQSYQALAADPDLSLAASNLWYCVAVFEHFGLLPAEVAGALTVAHHRLLAHVGDVELKARLAELAVQGDLTVDQLRVAVEVGKVANPEAKKRGRPPLPPVVKATDPVRKAVAELSRWDGPKVQALSPMDRAYALKTARAAARDLADWVAMLEAAGETGE